MSRVQRVKSNKYKRRDTMRKLGRWSGRRKGRHSHEDRYKNKETREWFR